MPDPASLDALRRAQTMARAGDLAGAAVLCRQLLAREASNFYALVMLGGIESDRKNFAEAEVLLARAVRVNPRSPEALGSYGNVLIERGQRDDGIRALSEALRLQPQNPATYVFRGYAHAQGGDHAKALADFDAAVRLAPDWEFALHNRASALIALNRYKEARGDVEKLLRLAPSNVPVLTNYSHILSRDGKYREALATIERALALDPGNAELMNTKATALNALNRPSEALQAIDNALAIRPGEPSFAITRANILAALSRIDDAVRLYETMAEREPANIEVHIGCANLLMDQDRLFEALHWVDKAIAVKPDCAPAWTLRANLLLHLERYDESFSAYDKAVATGVDYPEASYHRGSISLLHGRFVEGWRDFERRFEVADCNCNLPTLNAARWRGEPLKDRNIVVFSEQGLGDAIQFVRFLPRLVEMGARVTFLCHPALMRLFRNFAAVGIDLIVSCRGDRKFDYQCPLMSLPERLATTIASLPNQVPYIFAEPELVEKWRTEIGDKGFKIGICWQGNPAGKIDKDRSFPLVHFEAIAAIPGVRLISLQRTHGLDQLAQLPSTMRVETLPPFDTGTDAFIDTAAIMQNLDLVVTSDTSVAHLAGALGRTVWVALKHTPDWRWMLNRSDSPWYPSMRLFRQKHRRDWAGVFAEIADALQNVRTVAA
ncbi:MAG TPA: tetratricopeptide repeat protein [Micropepsaceae bacterium]|nr:tetratricopeptide repeat protein [Micropepsaceae bacterium]